MPDKTVLVIEDDELNLKLVTAILSREGFRVVGAESAEKGLPLVRSEKPHIVLMDLKLPGMDGLAATRLIRSDPATARVPVIAVTAYAMDIDVRRAIAAGCDACVTKPLDLKSFVETVRTHAL
jgi:two-component system, cell cycle response regulator DivK